jgi:hypothetical protein
VYENVNALQKPVDILAIAQIAMRDILVATKRLQRTKPGGAKVDALREQRSAQELPELPVCARQCDPGHGLSLGISSLPHGPDVSVGCYPSHRFVRGTRNSFVAGCVAPGRWIQ